MLISELWKFLSVSISRHLVGGVTLARIYDIRDWLLSIKPCVRSAFFLFLLLLSFVRFLLLSSSLKFTCSPKNFRRLAYCENTKNNIPRRNEWCICSYFFLFLSFPFLSFLFLSLVLFHYSRDIVGCCVCVGNRMNKKMFWNVKQ